MTAPIRAVRFTRPTLVPLLRAVNWPSGPRSRASTAARRDPESQAFIESWFGKLKEREVWPNEYETLDDARRGIGGYVDRYHHRPHSGLGYRTPDEVRRTWEDGQRLQKSAA
jgi:transposase InsO family protein